MLYQGKLLNFFTKNGKKTKAKRGIKKSLFIARKTNYGDSCSSLVASTLSQFEIAFDFRFVKKSGKKIGKACVFSKNRKMFVASKYFKEQVSAQKGSYFDSAGQVFLKSKSKLLFNKKTSIYQLAEKNRL